MTRLVIVVPTFRRPRMASNLIDSLREAIDLCVFASVKIVLVDNDTQESARGVVALHRDLDIEYVHEPAPGISAARNAGIRSALDSDYIVFVDDDEEVAPTWLFNLMRVQSLYLADLVAGPVYPRFPAGANQDVIRSGLFDRVVRPDGAPMYEAASGNLLFRTSVFASRSEDRWFDIAFGLSGGEDAELTRRLVRDGCSIRWSAEAVAWEHVAIDRISFRWLARRFRRVGSVDARLSMNNGRTRLRNLAAGILRICVSAPILVWYRVARNRIYPPAFRRFFRGMGFVEACLNVGVFEYARLANRDRGRAIFSQADGSPK